MVAGTENRKLTATLSELAGRAVRVWCVRTEAPIAVITKLGLVLSPEERDRAQRFRFDHLQHSFVVARAGLRILAGQYLSLTPATIRFNYGAKGKPSLADFPRLRFNVSHSGKLAVFAFALDCEVGVDLERIRPLPDIPDIAERLFCAGEAAELMSLSAEQRELAFFLCWTRKEAYIKATGDGLSAPLDTFHVTLQPGKPARFVHIAHDVIAANCWMLHDLRFARDYAGALAYRDAQRPVHLSPLIEPVELLDIC